MILQAKTYGTLRDIASASCAPETVTTDSKAAVAKQTRRMAIPLEKCATK